jgi:hypothetical protein
MTGMRIVCSLNAQEGERPDVLVLPENTCQIELSQVIKQHPLATIVAAVKDGPYMRAQLIKNGINQIDYLKALPDGRSKPFNGPQPALPFYEDQEASLAMGVLICRDFECNKLRVQLLARFESSRAEYKLLCIPADMCNDFFGEGPGLTFPGVFVALSNHCLTYKNPCRCLSFVADPHRTSRVTPNSV